MMLSVYLKNPYNLFLIIPVLVILGIMFFLYPKKIRYQKARIITLSLSFLSFLVLIFFLAGFQVERKKKEKIDEIIFLVDSSLSMDNNKKEVEDFLNEAISIKGRNEKVGVILFGKDQKEIKKLSYSKKIEDNIFNREIIKTKTNLHNALEFAISKFKNPKKGKVILLSDLKATDKDCKLSLDKAVASGISLDILHFNNVFNFSEQEIVSFDILTNVSLIKPTSFEVKIKSNKKTKGTIKLFDNEKEVLKSIKEIKKGSNTYKFSYTFKEKGIHKLEVKLISPEDTIKENNSYVSYVNIEKPNRVLIIDKNSEGEELYNTIKDTFEVTKITTENLPKKLEELLFYDLVVLANTKTSDLGSEFLNILDEYLKKRGGSLFTTGGSIISSDGKKIPNIYNPIFTKGTILEDMLPVKTEVYTPPIAVCFLIDNSGSMGTTLKESGKTYIREAADRAISSLDGLSDRDYVSFITFTSDATIKVPFTLKSKLSEIKEKLNRLDCEMQGTVYSNAIEKATLLLNEVNTVNKKHIIFISDGEPSGGDSRYLEKIKEARKNEITLSTISFLSEVKIMKKMAEIGGGKHYYAKSGELLEKQLKADLGEKELREYEEKAFRPKLVNEDILLSNFEKNELPIINSFYGSKLKEDASLLLKGDYNQPILAIRDYGLGKTASFMADLDKLNTPDFFNGIGKILLEEIIKTIMPKEEVKNLDIGLDLIKNKSSLLVSVNTDLKKEERLNLVLEEIGITNKKIKEIELSNFNKMEILDLVLENKGLYKISINKYNKNILISKKEKFVALEKDLESEVFCNDINENHLEEYNKNLIKTPQEVYNNLSYNKLVKKDPKIILIIIFIILFLFDIFLSRLNLDKKERKSRVEKNNDN